MGFLVAILAAVMLPAFALFSEMVGSVWKILVLISGGILEGLVTMPSVI
jgi:hypothetical protein